MLKQVHAKPFIELPFCRRKLAIAPRNDSRGRYSQLSWWKWRRANTERGMIREPCATRCAVYDGGDHHSLVGRVIKASFDARVDPLLYFRGRYRRLHFD